MSAISKEQKNKYFKGLNGKRLVLRYKTKECDICLENFNNNNKIKIKCEYCDMNACSSCCIRYMSENDKIQCMNVSCNREWSYRFLMSSFKNSSLQKRIKEIYSNKLFNLEKTHFKDRLEYENKLNALNLKLKKCNEEYTMNTEIYESFKEHKIVYSGIENEKDLEKLRECIDELNQKVSDIYDNENENEIENENELKKVISDFVDNININIIKNENNYLSYSYLNVLRYDLYLYKSTKILLKVKNEIEMEIDEIWDDVEKGIKLPEVLSFKCPDSECRGMYNVNDFKCLACNNDICSSCREFNTNEHKCNVNTLETLKVLSTDSKPCPKCYTFIHKIDGCDQMWCTLCHTAFSWRTGVIETKIHNPHYYEWLRNISEGGIIPRNAGDNPNVCGPEELQLMPINDFNDKVNTHYEQLYKIGFNQMEDVENKPNELFQMMEKVNMDLSERIIKSVNDVLYMREEMIFKYGNDDNRLNNFITCVNYLSKRISEDEYKRYLHKENRKRLFNMEVLDIINLMIELKIEVVNKFMNLLNDEISSTEDCRNSISVQIDLVNRLDYLKSYIKPLFENIETVYKKKICKELKRMLNE